MYEPEDPKCPPPNVSIHTIRKLRHAGKYCEIWLEPPISTDDRPCMATKWEELNRAVIVAGLEDVVLNDGHRRLRVAVRGASILMISTTSERPARPPASRSPLDEG